jgi:PncC family amidohydrolase
MCFNFQYMKHKIFELLKEKKLNFSLVESCTGGGLAKDFVALSGASDFLKGSLVAYQDETKAKVLGVDQNLISKFTSVSEPVAKEMAQKGQKFFNSDYTLSTTGWAGPGGGTAADPVGTVYFGLCGKRILTVERRTFTESNSRERVIEEAIKHAWDFFYRELVKIY